MNSDRLILTNIEKAFGSKKILTNVSFSIGANEIVGLGDHYSFAKIW